MRIKHYSRLAEALVFVHGEHACDEALRMADLYERSGDSQTATDWRRTLSNISHSHCAAKSADVRVAA